MEEVLPNTTTEAESEEISEYDPEPVEKISKPLNMAPGAVRLRSWLNKTFRIEMTDGRVLIGVFLCTDRDANIILGSCSEYLPSGSKTKILNEEPRMLGLVMIPGKHIVNIHIDENDHDCAVYNPLSKTISSEDVVPGAACALFVGEAHRFALYMATITHSTAELVPHAISPDHVKSGPVCLFNEQVTSRAWVVLA